MPQTRRASALDEYPQQKGWGSRAVFETAKIILDGVFAEAKKKHADLMLTPDAAMSELGKQFERMGGPSPVGRQPSRRRDSAKARHASYWTREEERSSRGSADCRVWIAHRTGGSGMPCLKILRHATAEQVEKRGCNLHSRGILSAMDKVRRKPGSRRVAAEILEGLRNAVAFAKDQPGHARVHAVLRSGRKHGG